jgi:hypothetical protein
MKFLEQTRQMCQTKHYSPRTEESYTRWIERFVRFHREAAGQWVHPNDMSAEHVEASLTCLAVRRRVAASTQNQALNALAATALDLHWRILKATSRRRPRLWYEPGQALRCRQFAQEVRATGSYYARSTPNLSRNSSRSPICRSGSS